MKTDRKLVSILQAHGRKLTASIARDLNLPRTTVQARIARLERDGNILGYSANLAFHTGGNVAAMVSARLSGRPCSIVLDIVLQWPEVLNAYSISGENDAVRIASAPTTNPCLGYRIGFLLSTASSPPRQRSFWSNTVAEKMARRYTSQNLKLAVMQGFA